MIIKNKNINKICRFLVLLSPVIAASEKPPLFPVAQKIVPDVWVPESSYYHAKAGDANNVFMGPCSPCICAQICDENSECLYIHQHHSNDMEEPVKKIYQHLHFPQESDKHKLHVTVFTHIDTPEKKGVFQEGNHKKRVERFMEQLHKNAHIATEHVYYTQSSPKENAQQGYRDSFILFNERKAHRIDIKKQKYMRDLDPQRNPVMDEYITDKLKNKMGVSVDLSRYDNPLVHITKPNISDIITECEMRRTRRYVQEIIKGRPF